MSIQLVSVEPQVGLDPRILRLIAADEALAGNDVTENTRRARASDWRAWSNFACSIEMDPYVGDVNIVRLYVADMVLAGRKWSTIRRHLDTIAHEWEAAGVPSPLADPSFKKHLKSVRRTVHTRVDQRPPISPADLEKMCITLPSTNRGLRDRVVVVVGFNSALRRSELCRLNIENIQFRSSRIIIDVVSSKTDQEGAGRRVYVPRAFNPEVCPVRTLHRWIDVLGVDEGPLLRPVNRWDQVHASQRMQPKVVAEIVKRSAASAGLKDPDRFAGHSLRAGLATSLVDAGVSTFKAVQATGHKSERVFAQYVRKEAIDGEEAILALGL